MKTNNDGSRKEKNDGATNRLQLQEKKWKSNSRGDGRNREKKTIIFEKRKMYKIPVVFSLLFLSTLPFSVAMWPKRKWNSLIFHSVSLSLSLYLSLCVCSRRPTTSEQWMLRCIVAVAAYRDALSLHFNANWADMKGKLFVIHRAKRWLIAVKTFYTLNQKPQDIPLIVKSPSF